MAAHFARADDSPQGTIMTRAGRRSGSRFVYSHEFLVENTSETIPPEISVTYPFGYERQSLMVAPATSFLVAMLRITPSYSAHAATDYHLAGLKQAAYYTDHGPGVWHGRGAARLGLAAEVTRDDFAALAEGYHPRTHQKLVQRLKANRRAGMDLVFSAPKSLTLVYEYTRDRRMLEAFTAAVTETMEDIERAMQTQGYDRHGKKIWPVTGNLVWTQFLDFESRPTGYAKAEGEGAASPGPESIPDPHLHCHAFAFAPTWYDDKQCWQAGEFGGIKADGAYYEALFHNRLAAKIRALGYATMPTAGGRWWEIAGLSRRLIGKFSRRTAEIRDTARREGITNAAELDKLGAITRQGKTDCYTLAELRDIWHARLSAEDIIELENAGRGGGSDSITTADEAIAYALDKTLERSSVAERKALLTEALRYGAGQVSLEDLTGALKRCDILAWKDGDRTWLTTEAVAAEENAMCRYAREGMGTCAPLKVTPHAFAPVISEDGRAIVLSESQQRAVRHVLTARDAVMAVRGVAGSGKTTLLREARAAIEEGGKTVYAFAPTTAAADVLREEGFGQAATVQKLLASQAMQARMRGQVILVDEAGLVSVRQMQQLFAIAAEQGARVILVGDEYQHGSVERSDVNVLRILRDHAGLEPAHVTEIKRQLTADFRDAVAALSHADVAEGFDKLEHMGAIREISDHMERYRQLAADYFHALDTGKSAIIIAPSHAEGDTVTAILREGLKARGCLAAQDVRAQRLKNLNWTAADRRHVAFYIQENLAVEFTQNAKNIARGTRLLITGFDEGGNVLGRSRDGTAVRVPLEEAERFQVYAVEDMDLAVGETIRFTRNGEAANGERLVNGAVATIAGFTEDGNIVLGSGAIIAGDYGHIAPGYVATSHKAQGVTADAVFIAENPACGAASPEQLYVSASRGRDTVRIYTPDKDALLHAVSRARPAMSATALAQNIAREAERVRIARERQTHIVEAGRQHRDWQQRQEVRRHWPEGRLRRLWNRESGRVAEGLRRAWRVITGHGPEPTGAGL